MGGTPGTPSPETSLQWDSKADLPIAVRAATAAQHKSRIYVLAGNLTLSTWTDSNQIYDPANDTWTFGAPVPGSRDFSMAEALSDGVHLIAGRDAQFKMDHLVYDPGTDAWSHRAPLPRAVASAAIESFGNKIYVIGGNSSDQPIADVYIYDPAYDKWTVGKPMPTARFSATSTVNRGKILVAGGAVPGRNGTNAMESYDPILDRWETLPPIPFSAAALGGGTVTRGGTVGNSFCVFGGRPGGPSNDAFSETYCYNPVTKAWSAGPEMITGRIEAAWVEHAQSVYVIGGRTQDDLADPGVERLFARPR